MGARGAACSTAQAVSQGPRHLGGCDDAVSDAAVESWTEKLEDRPDAMALLGGLKFSLGRKEWHERQR